MKKYGNTNNMWHVVKSISPDNFSCRPCSKALLLLNTAIAWKKTFGNQALLLRAPRHLVDWTAFIQSYLPPLTTDNAALGRSLESDYVLGGRPPPSNRLGRSMTCCWLIATTLTGIESNWIKKVNPDPMIAVLHKKEENAY